MDEIEDRIYINDLHMFSDTLDLIRAYIYSNLKEESKIPKWIINGNFENTRLLFPTMPLVNFIYSKVLITKKDYIKVVALYDKSMAMAKIFPNLLCEIFENMHIAIAYDNLSKRKESVEKAIDIKKKIDLFAELFLPDDFGEGGFSLSSLADINNLGSINNLKLLGSLLRGDDSDLSYKDDDYEDEEYDDEYDNYEEFGEYESNNEEYEYVETEEYEYIDVDEEDDDDSK